MTKACNPKMVLKICERISCSSFSVKEIYVIVHKNYVPCIALLNFWPFCTPHRKWTWLLRWELGIVTRPYSLGTRDLRTPKAQSKSTITSLYILWDITEMSLKPGVVMMPTLSSLAAPEVVVTTTSGAASDGKIGIMTTISFRCMKCSVYCVYVGLGMVYGLYACQINNNV